MSIDEAILQGQEKEGWVWILTIVDQNQAFPNSELKGFDDDESENCSLDEDDDCLMTPMSIAGCYATRALLLEAAKKMKLEKFGCMHIVVEGLVPKAK